MFNVVCLVSVNVDCVLANRAENDKMAIKMETDDLRAVHDHLIGEKASQAKMLCNMHCCSSCKCKLLEFHA